MLGESIKSLILSALFILSSCADSTPLAQEPVQPNAGEHFQKGWRSVKKGGTEVASGVAVGAKKVGTGIHSIVCPVAGDRATGLYYAKDSRGYSSMLDSKRSNDRDCFSSEASAREKGYKIAYPR